MTETTTKYQAAPGVDAEPMTRLLATVRACVNRLVTAHLAYGAAECGPEYPRQREAEFAVAWERLERDIARERQRVTAALAMRDDGFQRVFRAIEAASIARRAYYAGGSDQDMADADEAVETCMADLQDEFAALQVDSAALARERQRVAALRTALEYIAVNQNRISSVDAGRLATNALAADAPEQRGEGGGSDDGC